MLQWMGGSKRKVITSRKSTQKRQKQYFEQRKRQQQNQQMMGSENCSDSLGIGGHNLKEHRSLDILNLLNLSTNSQKCNYSCLKGRGDGEINVSTVSGSISTNQPTNFTNMDTTVDSCRFEDAREPLCCQIETSPKKVLVSGPDNRNTTFIGPPSHWKTVTDQYSELSVIDLLYDDEPNTTMEKRPTCEDHVAFSLEGLGEVGTKTPVHSPEHWASIHYDYSPLMKDGSKPKLKNLNNVLDDIKLEVNTMMQDIDVSPISSPNFPFNKRKQSLSTATDCRHCYDHANKNGSSISDKFFKTENSNEDTWNASSSFLDEKFDNEEEYDTSWKRTFQMGYRSPELLKNGAYKMASYAFEDYLPKKRSSATAMEEINMSEPLASFSKDQFEIDFDSFVARRARCSILDGNFIAQNLVPEDVRDNSSLLSEESSSSAVVRGEAIKHSPSRIVAGENRRKHRDAFACPRNKCSSKEGKCSSMSNPSKLKTSLYSSAIVQEEFGAHNSWQFEERYASVDRSSAATSFCHNLEAKFAVSGSNNRTDDPLSVFTARELHNKATQSFGGFKKDAPVADSPPCSFTKGKFGFACSPVSLTVGSWPTGPSLSPNFQFKVRPQDVADFHCETSSTDTSVQGSVSKDEEIKVKLQPDRYQNVELRDDTFMENNEFSSEKKTAGNASTSSNHKQACEDTGDTNPKTTQCLETSDSLGHVEEISSSLKKPDNRESNADKTKSNFDADIPLKCKIANEEMEKSQHEGRNRLLRVQKVLKEACATPRKNSSFLAPGSNTISHQT